MKQPIIKWCIVNEHGYLFDFEDTRWQAMEKCVKEDLFSDGATWERLHRVHKLSCICVKIVPFGRYAAEVLRKR